MTYIEIDGRRIGADYEPYVIAELSANHNGDIARALEILEMAKRCGADAVKLQTYTQDTLTIDCDNDDFKIKGGLWHGRTLYDLYSEAHMPWGWHQPLFDRAKDLGITIFSTPFDHSAVDLLEDLGAPAYKIASFEAVDLDLIDYVARTGKPMIISTGMANQIEIEEAVATARNGGCREIAVLHCVSGYPAPAADYNLRTLTDLAQKLGVVVGLSDHTVDNATAITSVALGASVVEKHVTLDRTAGGPDDSFSLEPKELAELCRDAKVSWHSLGKVSYNRKSSEKNNVQFRRSLYVVRAIKAGDTVTEKDIRCIRPGFGLAPKFIGRVIGRVAKTDLAFGTPVKLEDFE